MATKRKNDILDDEIALERLEDVLRGINEGPKTPHARRVEEIMSWLQKLTETRSTLEKTGAVAKLRGLLARYRWVSYIAPSTGGLVVLNEVANHAQLPREDLAEQKGVRDLLAAFPQLGSNKRPYLRRCHVCRKWFIAPRSNTRTCKRTCYQWLRDNSSPEEKARKAAYMRRLRKDAKDRANRDELRELRKGFTKPKRRVVSKKSR